MYRMNFQHLRRISDGRLARRRAAVAAASCVAILFVVVASSASAQENPCSESAPAIYERVSPAVVFIEGTSINPYRTTQRVEHVVGSGFIIDTDGLVLTNSHVALGRQALSVTLDDGTVLPARLVAADPIFDIAVIEIPKPTTGTLPLETSSGSCARPPRKTTTASVPAGSPSKPL